MRLRWYWSVCLVVLLAGLATFGWLWITASRFQGDLTRAIALMGAHKFEEARPLLVDLNQQSPSDPETRYRLGVCQHALGAFPEAVAVWSGTDVTTVWGIEAGLARAKTLIGDLGRLSEAEAIFESLLSTPTLSRGELRDSVRQGLIELFFWEGRRDAIRRIIEDGWGNSTDPVGELRDHWRAEMAPTLIEKVREEIDHAATLAPEDDRVWLCRANLATQLGHFDEARTWLDRCLKSRPDDPVVWRARLDLARASDQPVDAVRALQKIPAVAMTEAERLDLRAWLARSMGSKAKERDALEQLIKVNPGENRALDRLSALCSEAGDREKSQQLRLRKAEMDASKDRYLRMLDDDLRPERFLRLATLADSLGRTFEARGWWTLRQAYEPDDHKARMALKRLGKVGTATTNTNLPGPKTTLADLLKDVLPKGGREETLAARSPGVVPRFQDDAVTAGLNFIYDNGRSTLRQIPETTAGGVGLIDYDEDGWIDVYVVQGGAFPADPNRPYVGDRLYHNRGNGTFEDATEKSGIAKMPRGFGHGVTVGDIDNDGHSDLFVTRWRSYALYRNKGDGTFEDVTERYGLSGDRDWPTSAAFADLDNDGDLDLYVAHYLVWDADNPTLCPRVTVATGDALSDPGQKYNYCTPRPFQALPDHLFRNDGNRFVDVTAEAGIVDTDGRGLGVVAADLDDDGLVDLFVANDTTANYFWHNLGQFKFEEIGIQSGVACNANGAFQAGMGTACGDLDGDGRPDLFVTNFYGESTTFYQNFGKGTFFDRTAAVGLAAPSQYLLGFGIVLFDVNNDGRLDLATANGHVNDDRPDYPYAMPVQLLVGGEKGQLSDVTVAAGSPWTVERVSRGLAAGDLDNDGKIDALVLPQQSPLGYFHNVKQDGMGHYVTLQLKGTKSNRDAIGAVVTVESAGKSRRAWRVGGGSYQSASDPRLHFGLAGASEIEKITVRWPAGSTDTFGPLKADKVYVLVEGAEQAVAR